MESGYVYLQGFMGRKFAIIVGSAFVFVGCTDFKGTADPFIYTPDTPCEDWQPKKAFCRLPFTLQPDDFRDVEQEDPLSLAEVIDIALMNNPGTKATWANTRIAASIYGRSLANDFILAQGNGTGTRFRQALFTGPDRSVIYSTIFSGDANLSYLVFDFGRTKNTSKAALESLYNADWTHNREIQTIMQTVMFDYYDFLYQEEKLAANKADVVDAQVTLESVLEKLRNGMADIGEKVQATTALLQNELNTVAQKQQVHNSYTQLAADMGIPTDVKIELDNYPDEITTFSPEDLDDLINTAISYRPDLIAAEASVKASNFGVKAARALYFPQLNTTFDIGRSYFSNEGQNDDYHFKAQAALSFPIFQGFAIKNTVRQAQARLQKAEAELRQTQLNVLQQVSNQREDVILAKEALEYAKAFFESAKEDYRVNLAKYRVGTGTITELLNAQTSVSDARAKLVLTKRDWFVSLANLAYALGTLAPPELKGKMYEKCTNFGPCSN